jgi:hypothetical protein
LPGPVPESSRRSVRPALDAPDELLTGAVEAAHHGALGDAEGAGGLLVRETRDIDRDERIAEVLRERGDRRVELGGLEGGVRVARARIGDQIQLVGERAGP